MRLVRRHQWDMTIFGKGDKLITYHQVSGRERTDVQNWNFCTSDGSRESTNDTNLAKIGFSESLNWPPNVRHRERVFGEVLDVLLGDQERDLVFGLHEGEEAHGGLRVEHVLQ